MSIDVTQLSDEELIDEFEEAIYECGADSASEWGYPLEETSKLRKECRKELKRRLAERKVE